MKPLPPLPPEDADFAEEAAPKETEFNNEKDANSPDEQPAFAERPQGTLLPLSLTRSLRVVPIERGYRARKDDVVDLAAATDQAEAAEAWLTERGWVREERASASSAPI